MTHPFAHELLAWYDRYGRDLPWRRTRDPYRIWISEVILQQTRIAQGREYYERFVRLWPDVRALAAASEDEVLKAWQGLGYYSRARNLLAAARRVVAEHGGEFPRDPAAVRALPGVGDYTAAAICSIACGEPMAAVDGNVYRVLARLYDIAQPVDSGEGRRLFAALAQELLPAADAGRYNQAMMDFGALQCTPRSPRCAECPFAGRCAARAAGSVAERPVKRGRTRVSERFFHYLHFDCRGETLLRKRGTSDIWRGLYEFPLVETPAESTFEEVSRSDDFRRLTADRPYRLVASVALPRHRLSHRTIRAVVHRIETGTLPAGDGLLRLPAGSLGDYAVPRLLERYLEAEVSAGRQQPGGNLPIRPA